MKYLTENDLRALIQDSHLGVVSQNQTINIETAEDAAKEEMAGYLRARYDINKIFLRVRTWNVSTTYSALQLVFYKPSGAGQVGRVWQAVVGNTGEIPGSSNVWVQNDPRNAIIVMYLADITIYHLHSNINPRNIPELRGIRYDAAIKWLTGVMKLQINPDLPLLNSEEPDRVRQVIHGGRRKQSYNF